MSDDSSKLILYRVSGERLGEARVTSPIDIDFPVDGIEWVWVLDARHEPYDAMSIDEVIARAEGVRKRYVLVAEAA